MSLAEKKARALTLEREKERKRKGEREKRERLEKRRISFTLDIIEGSHGKILRCPECKSTSGTSWELSHNFNCHFRYAKPTRGTTYIAK